MSFDKLTSIDSILGTSIPLILHSQDRQTTLVHTCAASFPSSSFEYSIAKELLTA